MSAPVPSRTRPPRQPKPPVLLEVVATRRLSPHLVRLTLGGEGFSDYQDRDATDKYIKLMFADPALGLTMPYDMEELRETLSPEQMPVRRTYTVRSVDHAAGTLDVDFVVHGEGGLAGPWAANAQVGDPVTFGGPGGMFLPDPDVDWYLLAGDESAIPAISSALEAMPAQATGIAIIEGAGPEDEIPLSTPEGIEVQWLHRGDIFSPESTTLAHTVIETPWRARFTGTFAARCLPPSSTSGMRGDIWQCWATPAPMFATSSATSSSASFSPS